MTRKYKTEEYIREDGKTVIIKTCTNPHWDAMPGEFDKVFLYDPVKAKEAKNWEEPYTFKTRNGRRTRMYILIGVYVMIIGFIGIILTEKEVASMPRPCPAWTFIPPLIMLVGLIIIIARLVYVGDKQNPYTCLKCPFPEDPGAF
ncbi:unnamed protein product [marine sediment metagenome]|uniref:Uncharacterized protein n=1 Tax=marine sediment metagenome TaxID=412755 RepID=X1GI31_9ZZZZ